ncbi:MAG: glycosyltransferase [Novosphingobium sp.]|nr:glycosyltransferase [Novosphingobium sp.]
MTNPAISVAMSVYNGERFLADAIRSILAQSFGDFEFLILDDGSTDSSRSIIAGFAASDSRIRPIIRENRGLIASLNQLLEEARAPLIARMDADDISHPERFSRQISFLAGHPDHGVLGTWSQDMDEFGNEYLAPGHEHPTTHEGVLRALDNDQQVLCHPAVMMRRDIVRSIGGYHAAFRHCEDLDLWLRLASVTRIANIPERLIRYRHYAAQVSSRHAVEQQIGAAIARAAYEERKADRPDPTESLERLPPIAELDALFGRPGITRKTRERVARSLLYSPVAMRGEGFDLLIQHLRDGGSVNGMWRTVARLVRFGEPTRALRLAAVLAKAA